MRAPLLFLLTACSTWAEARAQTLELDLAQGPELRAVRGGFEPREDGLELTTADQYDNAAFANIWLDGTWSVEVELTHRDGLVGGGLLFACRDADRAPPLYGQMVRFDTPGELLHGRFLRGQFHANGRISLPTAVPVGKRTVLRIDVDAASATAAVTVDGRVVARDLHLDFVAGHVAVQGSMGIVTFHRLSARAEPPEVPALRWPSSLVATRAGFEVLDGGGQRFLLPLDGGTARIAPAASTPFPPGLRAVPGARIVAGAVELDGGGVFTGRDVGGIDAVALARNGDGRLFALDVVGRRVVEVPPTGDAGFDHLVFENGEVRVDPPLPVLATGADGALLGVSGPDGFVGGFEPLADVVLRTPIAYRVWPGGAAGWRSIPFQAPPPDGLHRVRRLRVVVAVFGNVGETPADADAMPLLPPAGYARIEEEVRAAATWYFHHSGRRLWLDLAFVRRPDKVMAGELSETGEPNGAPPVALLHELAEQAQVPFAEVQGFVVAMDFRRRSGDGPEWTRVGRGGGLTLGAHGKSYGLSWWFVPSTPGYDGWLFCHEFHHQLDALFEISGHPEYPFNHFAPSLRNVAFFGEHWDGNRWILQSWPDHLWDQLRFGDFLIVADRDGDHVPDREPRLPFDEERFGSLPDRADTDGDGLDDGAEAALGRWLYQSGFESLLGGRLGPDPRRADSDGDGLTDAGDPEPLLPFPGGLREGSWQELRSVADPRLTASVAIRVAEGRIEIRTTTTDAASLQMQVLFDSGADGWFQGRINARVHARGSGARVVDVLDASDPVAWPTGRPELRDRLGVELQRGDGVVTLALRPEGGLQIGDVFALSIGYRGHLAGSSDPQWWSLFEPHRLVRFEVTR